MRGKTISLVLTAAVAVFLCCDRSFGQDDNRFVKKEVLKEVGLQYYWSATLTGMEKGEVITHLYKPDENIYCMTNLNRVFVVDAATGVIRWNQRLADLKQTVFQPMSSDKVTIRVPQEDEENGADVTVKKTLISKLFNIVAFNTLDTLIILERSTGKILVRYPLGFSANTGGAIDGMNYYGGCTNGTEHCLRLSDGIKLWSQSLNYLGDIPVKINELRGYLQGTTDEDRKAELRNQIANLTAKMNRIVQKNPYDMITAPLAYYNKKVYIANETGQLISTSDADNLKGRHEWQFMAYGSIVAPFSVDGRGCFIGSTDCHIYGLNAESGMILDDWKDGPFLCKGPIKTQVLASKTNVFAYADKDAFYAINISNGKLKWKNTDARTIVGVIGGDDYLVDKDNNLLDIDNATGNVKAKIPMVGMDICLPNALTPAMYFASKDGKIFCVNPISAGRLTADMIK